MSVGRRVGAVVHVAQMLGSVGQRVGAAVHVG